MNCQDIMIDKTTVRGRKVECGGGDGGGKVVEKRKDQLCGLYLSLIGQKTDT